MKKVVISLLILMLTVFAVFNIVRVFRFTGFLEQITTRGIGKTLYVKIDSNGCDGDEIRKGFELWPKPEKYKLADYLERNNLRIKQGEYKINQTTTFEEAVKIFKFESIE